MLWPSAFFVNGSPRNVPNTSKIAALYSGQFARAICILLFKHNIAVMKTMEPIVKSHILNENGIKIRRIEVRGTPTECAKCMESIKCAPEVANNSVRSTVVPSAPIVKFADPLATWKRITYKIPIRVELWSSQKETLKPYGKQSCPFQNKHFASKCVKQRP